MAVQTIWQAPSVSDPDGVWVKYALAIDMFNQRLEVLADCDTTFNLNRTIIILAILGLALAIG